MDIIMELSGAALFLTFILILLLVLLVSKPKTKSRMHIPEEDIRKIKKQIEEE